MLTAMLCEPKRRRPLEQPVKSLATLIAGHPFLAGMKPAHLEMLCECAMQTQFPKDQLIFREGDLANRFYLLEEGRVALESHAGGDRAVLIHTLGKGDVLGWSWLFPPYYWHFDARTLAPTKAIFFYGTRLRAQCEEDHDFGYELLKRMAEVVILRLQAARELRADSFRKGDLGVEA
jgi:CRP-like cAMP-binding protein